MKTEIPDVIVTVGLGSTAGVVGGLASIVSLSGKDGEILVPANWPDDHKLNTIRVDFQTKVRSHSRSGRKYDIFHQVMSQYYNLFMLVAFLRGGGHQK